MLRAELSISLLIFIVSIEAVNIDELAICKQQKLRII